MTARRVLQRVMLAVGVPALRAYERLTTGVTYYPLDPAYRVDPYPFYRRLRERDPFHRSTLLRGWVVSRYDDAVAILRDPRFLVDDTKLPDYPTHERQRVEMGLLEEGEHVSLSMLRRDPPDHTRLRSLVNKAFTPRMIERLQPRIEAIVDELLDAAASRGHIDIISDLATPLPVTVIAEMIGVPVEDRGQFKAWSDDAIYLLSATTLDESRRALTAVRELRTYLSGLAEARKREPREDLLSSLLQVETDGDALSEGEVIDLVGLLLVAGHETTTNLIGNGLLALLRHPDQMEALRRDPSLVPGAVEECLRYDSPIQVTLRFSAEDIDWDGHTIKAWKPVVVLLGSANRDPSRFPDPERFDITRTDHSAVAFGHGIHFCLGAPLAKREAQTAFAALLERFPRLRLSTDDVEWGNNLILRGLKSLPVAV